MKLSDRQKNIIEVIAYMSWTLCIYVLSYYTVNRENLNVNIYYQLAGFILMIASIWLFKTETIELVKELLKVTGILIGTIILSRVIDDSSVSMEQTIKLIISNVVHAIVISGFMIWYAKRSLKILGNKSYILHTVELLAMMLVLFIFKWGLVIAIIVYIAIDMTLGYSLFKKYFKEKRIEEQKKYLRTINNHKRVAKSKKKKK